MFKGIYKQSKRILTLFVLLSFLPFAQSNVRDPIVVAVASNFSATMKHIVSRYTEETGHAVKLSIASTGKHYAQIRYGAPFDAFFAADSTHIELLEQDNLTIKESRFTYALGQVALIKSSNLTDLNKVSDLPLFNVNRIAIANAKLAPYGVAAQALLKRYDLTTLTQPKLIVAENIAQVFNYYKTGHVDLAFVAYSYIVADTSILSEDYILIPSNDYPAIVQQAVALNSKPNTVNFINYVKHDPEVQKIIASFGYLTAQELSHFAQYE